MNVLHGDPYRRRAPRAALRHGRGRRAQGRPAARPGRHPVLRLDARPRRHRRDPGAVPDAVRARRSAGSSSAISSRPPGSPRAGATGRPAGSRSSPARPRSALPRSWSGAASRGATTPAGPGPVFALAGVCLLAGLLDLNAILRAKLTPAQRIARHLWRMCFAFFIATGSFFLGQQDVLPAGGPRLADPLRPRLRAVRGDGLLAGPGADRKAASAASPAPAAS